MFIDSVSVCVCVQVAGVSTNIEFLRRLAAHENFESADVHTGFIPVGNLLYPSH